MTPSARKFITKWWGNNEKQCQKVKMRGMVKNLLEEVDLTPDCMCRLQMSITDEII